MRLIAIIGLVIALIAGFPLPARGLPGEDADHPRRYFDILVRHQDTGEQIGSERFRWGKGWDFGDRPQGYRCAWVEFFRAGIELFEIHFERAQGWAKIIDRFGPESDATKDRLCGKGSEGPVRFDGSDHFPHGTLMDFTRNGSPLVTLNLHADECASGYWTPGDEPGEAWLWWDEDGPTNDGHHELDCGGGPTEPVPVVRAYVKKAAPGIEYCSEDSLAGDRCTDHSPRSHLNHLMRPLV